MDQLPSTLDEDDEQGLVAAHERSEGGGGDESMEKMFERLEVAAWEKQLTTRALLVSFVLSLLFSVIVIKLNLTTGLAPGFNVSAGLLGYFFIKTWTKFLEKSRLLKQPFNRQENTVIQTCVVASCSVASSGGFGSYLLGMSQVVAKQSTEANDPRNVKNLSLSWMIGFLFLISFLGLFSVLPLRKIMIIDFKLIYPSGSATAHLINSFHTPSGANLATKQVRTLGKYFSLSFLWGFFQWFFAATEGCGFANFPTFGLKAFQNKFYFDFSATYIGVGMVCPYITNVSLLLGAFMSWGVMWPLIEKKKGDWFSSDLPPSSLQSLQGYRVFIAIAMILGDGLSNFFKVLGRTFHGLYHQLHHIMMGQSGGRIYPPATALSYDDERRTQLFLNDKLPTWFAFAGYITIAIISTATIPHIFHQLKWYHIVVIYIFSPALAFCNAYGSGLTNWSMSPTYGKLAIFVIGAWVGSAHGGVLAGLAACGVMMNIVSTASDLMQDFKTGYMTLASPRSMFVSQIIGTAMGSVISPCVFWIFLKAFPDLGLPNSQYPAPYALIYRNVAILSVEGVLSLPKHCLTLCYVFFALALIINGVKDAVGPKWARFIPLPMAMSIPFYLGGSFAVDMCVGSLILLVWESIDKANADALGAAVASGLICGEGIWTLPSSVLSLAGVKPPICMKFLSRKDSARVDAFLAAS